MPIPLALIPLITAAAPYVAGGAMAFWAGTNVYQTHKISGDNASSLDWQKKRYYMERNQDLWQREAWETEQENREIDYNRSLFQTGMIEAFDSKGRKQQATMQQADLNFQAQMFNKKQAQLEEDRNRYLLNQAFQANSGRPSYNEDRLSLAFILSELQNLAILQEQSNNSEDTNFYDDDNIEEDIYNDYDPEEEYY